MSISLEKKRVFQTNVHAANASCRKKLDGGHSEADNPDVQNGRLHPEDLPNSCEKCKSNGETKIADHPHNMDGKDEEMEAKFEAGEIHEIENIDQTEVANPTQRVGEKGEEMEDVNDEHRKISYCHREMEAEFEEGEILYIGNIHETEVANPTQLVGGKGEETEIVNDEHRKIGHYHREMDVEFEEGEIREDEDMDEAQVAKRTQLMGGKCEEIEVVNDEHRKIRDYHLELDAEFEEGEIRDIGDLDEREVANPTQFVGGKGEEMEAVNDEDRKIRHYHQVQIEESMQAKSMAPENNDKLLDSNVVSSGKDDDLQESLNQKTANGGDCVDNGGLKMNQIGSFIEQQAACKELDGEGDETFEEVSRIKSVLDDSNNLSGRMLLELLTKLQELDVNMEILQGTMIGKTVNVFQKHAVKEIREVARSLIRTWRGKVDEWVQVHNRDSEARSSELDELPPCTLNEEAPVAPSGSTQLLQIFHGVDQPEFFSILPRDFDGSCLFPAEPSIAERRGTPIKLNHLEDAVTEKMRVEDLSRNSRNAWRLLGSQDAKKKNQDTICQNALGSHKGKDVSGKDLAEKQKVKQVKVNMNTFSRDKESEEATMEQRIPSLPKRLGVENYEHYVSNKGIMRCRSSAMKFGVSTLQHRPVVPTRVKSSSQFGQNMQMPNSSRQPLFMQQDRMPVSESSMLQKVEETRKKLTEGYQNAEDAKKRHAIQVIHANDSYANQQHKRFRLHDARKN